MAPTADGITVGEPFVMAIPPLSSDCPIQLFWQPTRETLSSATYYFTTVFVRYVDVTYYGQHIVYNYTGLFQLSSNTTTKLDSFLLIILKLIPERK